MENIKSDMAGRSKIRNPFPRIGKVFKYEMKDSWRILLPVYIASVIISFITGLTMYSKDGTANFNFSIVVDSNNTKLEGVRSGAAGILLFMLIILVIASFVITVMILNRRFSKGLLGDEAYLNLALPVTIGEHLWGRILSVIVWGLGYSVAMLLSFMLLTYREWHGNLSDIISDISAGNIFGIFLIIYTFGIMLILFCYLINGIGHMSKKHRGLTKILSIIVILTVTSKIEGSLNTSIFTSLNNASAVLYSATIVQVVLSAIYGTATYFILKIKLNLE